MRNNAEGDVILTDTEKQTILEGMRLLSVYCENLAGCLKCPFMKVNFIDDNGNVTRACECRNYLPCVWDVPEKWESEKGADV